MNLLNHAFVLGFCVYFFYRRWVAVDFNPDDEILFVKLVVEIAAVIVIIILLKYLEHLLECGAKRCKVSEINMLLKMSKTVQDWIGGLMIFTEVFAVIVILYCSDNTTKLVAVAVALLILSVLFIVSVSIEGVVTSVAYPVPSLYIALGVLLIVISVSFEGVPMGADRVLDKEVIQNFAQAFIVVAGTQIFGDKRKNWEKEDAQAKVAPINRGPGERC